MRVEAVNSATKVHRAGHFDGSGSRASHGTGSPSADKRSDIPVEQKSSSERSISEKAFIEMVERANKALQGVDKRFEFSIHEGTHEIMVKVVNEENGQVIREIPPEKILDLIAKLWEVAGIFVDEKR